MHSNPSKFDMGAGRVYPEIFYSNDSICKFKKSSQETRAKDFKAVRAGRVDATNLHIVFRLYLREKWPVNYGEKS